MRLGLKLSKRCLHCPTWTLHFCSVQNFRRMPWKWRSKTSMCWRPSAEQRSVSPTLTARFLVRRSWNHAMGLGWRYRPSLGLSSYYQPLLLYGSCSWGDCLTSSMSVPYFLHSSFRHIPNTMLTWSLLLVIFPQDGESQFSLGAYSEHDYDIHHAFFLYRCFTEGRNGLPLLLVFCHQDRSWGNPLKWGYMQHILYLR